MTVVPSLSLSAHLFESYASYKKDTYEVIRWLTRNAEPYMERASLTSVRELRYLADYVILNRVEIPGNLIQTFRRVIQSRKRLTNFYKRGSDQSVLESTETHKYFNDALEEVWKDLNYFYKQSNCLLPKASSDSCIVNLSHDNAFQCLDCISTAVAEERTKDHSPAVLPANFDTIELKRTREKHGPSIEDDPLEELTSIHEYLMVSFRIAVLLPSSRSSQQLDLLTSTVKKSYYSAQKGDIPLEVAALTTDCAYQCGKSLSFVPQKYHFHNPLQLIDRRASLLDDLLGARKRSDSPIFEGEHSIYLENMDSGDLHLIWEELSHFRETLSSRDDLTPPPPCLKCGGASCKPLNEDPMEFMYDASTSHIPPDEREKIDRAFVQSLLRGLYQEVQNCRNLERETPFKVALIEDLEAFIKAGASNSSSCSNCLDLSFGLHLLCETYRSFCQADHIEDGSDFVSSSASTALRTSPGRLPRLHALKLSATLCAAVKGTVKGANAPCNCVSIQGTVLLSLLVDSANIFNHFARRVQFDLLHQAPWIAGRHAVSQLVQVSECGSMLWHFGYFVGTVLHVYNALVQSKLLTPTQLPALEALCDIYKDSLFLGKRPTHNVYSRWQRWTGAKIKPTSHREQIDANTTDRKWHLCAVHDSSHGGNTWSRSFSPKKVSLFTMLASGKSVLDDEVTTCIYLSRQKSRNVSHPILQDIGVRLSPLWDC